MAGGSRPGDRPSDGGIRCMLMRGGTSKGAYFLAEDLPGRPDERDELLLRVMGSPDPRQIDGIGGAHPLTSKVAVVGPPTRAGAAVDYLFLQVGVAEAFVTDKQNCGNLLAGIGPFAVERGLVPATGERTDVRIHLVNTGELATASFATPGGRVDHAEPILLEFAAPEGRALLPTGRVRDLLDGVEATCVDNGMPTVRAAGCGPRRHRIRIPGGARVGRAAGRPDRGRARRRARGDGPGRRAVAAQDHPARTAARRREHQYTHIHPGALP